MSVRLGIVMDPIARINFKKDSPRRDRTTHPLSEEFP